MDKTESEVVKKMRDVDVPDGIRVSYSPNKDNQNDKVDVPSINDISYLMLKYRYAIDKIYADYKSNHVNCTIMDYEEYKQYEESIKLEQKTNDIYAYAMRVLFSHYKKFKNGDCEVFPIKEFIEEVKQGDFYNYDGIGFFSDIDGNEYEQIDCNVDWLNKNKKDYPFVIWYDK